MTTTATHRYTSALMSLDLKVLSFDENNRLNFTPSNYGGGAGRRYHYLQDIVVNDQISNTSLWQNISALECAKYKPLQTDRSTLLIVIKETLEQVETTIRRGISYEVSHQSSSSLLGLLGLLRYRLHPTNSWDEQDCDNSDKWPVTVAYCLSRKVPGRSRLQIHLSLHLTVTILSAIKLSCLLLTFREQQGTPLVTNGDAIASFLSSPCVHSAGMCLLPQEELVRKLKDKHDKDDIDAAPIYKPFELRRMRYYRSVSPCRWIIYISSYGRSCLCYIMIPRLPPSDLCYYYFSLSISIMALG